MTHRRAKAASVTNTLRAKRDTLRVKGKPRVLHQQREEKLVKAARLEVQALNELQEAATIYLSLDHDGDYGRVMAARGVLLSGTIQRWAGG